MTKETIRKALYPQWPLLPTALLTCLAGVVTSDWGEYSTRNVVNLEWKLHTMTLDHKIWHWKVAQKGILQTEQRID